MERASTPLFGLMTWEHLIIYLAHTHRKFINDNTQWSILNQYAHGSQITHIDRSKGTSRMLDYLISNCDTWSNIITDHDKINYKMLYQNSKIIFDCRNRFKIDPRKKNSKIIQL